MRDSTSPPTGSTATLNTPLPRLFDSLPPETTALSLDGPLSPANLTALTTFLSKSNTQITTLSLSNHPLPPSLPATLLQSLPPTTPLTTLILQSASLTPTCTPPIAHLLCSHPLVPLTLDLSNNRLNHRGILTLQSALLSRPPDFPKISLILSGNLHTVEVLNTVTHAIGAALAVFGGFFLTIRAYFHHLPVATVFSLATFALSLVTLLTSSAVYHAHFRNPRLSTKLRKLDHCSIFVLIAGSYTPFIVGYALDPPTVFGPITLLAVWTCAAIGITRSLMGVDSNRSRSLFALVTGWLGLMVTQTMMERMERENVGALVAGGVSYSLGILFYLGGKRIPFLHVIWHFAVLFGGAFHFIALWNYVAWRDGRLQ
eukprot:GFKZ01009015.1.p1 GENE.GFKZ01009015.1~~GFKZ01009015.1.p1  ORF type:complete len:372 (-),score=31.07 GFKZ01009015.1:599-1714(-)